MILFALRCILLRPACSGPDAPSRGLSSAMCIAKTIPDDPTLYRQQMEAERKVADLELEVELGDSNALAIHDCPFV